VVVEMVVVVVLAVPDAFLDILDAFLDILDGSVLAFLSSCWPFVVVVAFEQQPRHQQAGDSEEDSFLVPD
jgi:F0F1-type ATP synthase assembly protein I